MLKFLINVIQDSLNPMILLGMITVVYSLKNNRLKRYLSLGIYLGLFSSIVLALLKANTTLISLEYQNIIINSILIFFEIVFMAFSMRMPKLEEEHRNRDYTISKCHFAYSTVYAILVSFMLLSFMPKVILYTRDIPFGEPELFSTNVLYKIFGYALGIIGVMLISMAVYHIFVNFKPKNIMKMLSLIFLIEIVNQSLFIVKPLLARRLIPMNQEVFKFVMVGTNNANMFLFLFLALIFFPPIVIWIKSYVLDQNYSNPAQYRKIKAAARSRRRWSILSLVIILFFSFSLTVLKAYNERQPVLSPAEEYIDAGDLIKIPVEQVNDGHLHRFEYISAGKIDMRFIVIQKSKTAFGIGLDACEICGPTGYYERSDGVVCKRCDVVMNTSTIGLPGGCNPIPFSYEVKDGFIVIHKSVLDAIERNFK